MARPRLLAASLASVAALALAACGGDTEEKNDYVDDVNAVTATLNSGLTEVSTEANRVSADIDATISEINSELQE